MKIGKREVKEGERRSTKKAQAANSTSSTVTEQGANQPICHGKVIGKGEKC